MQKGVVLGVLELSRDDCPIVRSQSAPAIGMLSDITSKNLLEPAVKRLLELSEDSEWGVRSHCVIARGKLGYVIPYAMRAKVVKRVFELTRDSKDEVRGFASVALGKLKYIIPKDMMSKIVKNLLDMSYKNDFKKPVLESISNLIEIIPAEKKKDVINRLIKLTRDEAWVGATASVTIGEIGKKIPADMRRDVAKDLLELTHEKDENVRCAAIDALGNSTLKIENYLSLLDL